MAYTTIPTITMTAPLINSGRAPLNSLAVFVGIIVAVA